MRRGRELRVVGRRGADVHRQHGADVTEQADGGDDVRGGFASALGVEAGALVHVMAAAAGVSAVMQPSVVVRRDGRRAAPRATRRMARVYRRRPSRDPPLAQNRDG